MLYYAHSIVERTRPRGTRLFNTVRHWLKIAESNCQTHERTYLASCGSSKAREDARMRRRQRRDYRRRQPAWLRSANLQTNRQTFQVLFFLFYLLFFITFLQRISRESCFQNPTTKAETKEQKAVSGVTTVIASRMSSHLFIYARPHLGYWTRQMKYTQVEQEVMLTSKWC